MKSVIAHLNERTGKRFRAVGKNETLINSLLKDYSIEDIKCVVDAKCTEWLGDAKMEKYLRPQTLFNKTKFQSYYEQINPISNKSLTPRQIEHREYIKTPKWLSLRLKRLKIDSYLCQGCGTDVDTHSADIHHLTYVNFKDEFLYELLTLCRECHSRVHGKDTE